MKVQTNNRIHGLDILRSAAIILVFMYHYMVFVSKQATFGFLSDIGWVGVDLFFVLSGYLIGHQILSPIANQHKFSFRIFYSRRLLRTLPNYLFILSIYFLIPSFREATTLPPLWKFITFTQNFGLRSGTAFSHSWSLCIEEQFYLLLPLLALVISYKKSIRIGWVILAGLLISGIILRGSIWIYYTEYASNLLYNYNTKIYYSSFCRLDELLLGVAIAMLRNFHKDAWNKVIKKGNFIFLFGIIGSGVTFYMFLDNHYGFFMTTFGYTLLAISFASLTLAALSPNCYILNVKIPGAATLATWSYAIYLIHKPLSVVVYSVLSKWEISASGLLAILIIVFASLICGALLHLCIETPFLRLRDKIGKMSLDSQPTEIPKNIIQDTKIGLIRD